MGSWASHTACTVLLARRLRRQHFCCTCRSFELVCAAHWASILVTIKPTATSFGSLRGRSAGALPVAEGAEDRRRVCQRLGEESHLPTAQAA
jgi:hypothetical protein